MLRPELPAVAEPARAQQADLLTWFAAEPDVLRLGHQDCGVETSAFRPGRKRRSPSRVSRLSETVRSEKLGCCEDGVQVPGLPRTGAGRVLNRTFGCVRVVWNRALAWRHQRYYGEQVKTGFTQANAYLTAMKATPELAWLNEVSSVPLQQAIRHQQVAYTNFFAGRARYPRYKSRTGRQSAEFTRSGFRYRDGRLFLAKMDMPLEFVWSWPDIDPASINPTTVTVSRDPCGRWYVSFAVEVAGPDQIPATGAVVGVDLGIKDFAVTSGGVKIPNPRKLARREPTWPGISAGSPAARKAPRTGLRPRPRSPARTGRSARPAPTSCTAPLPAWSATTT